MLFYLLHSPGTPAIITLLSSFISFFLFSPILLPPPTAQNHQPILYLSVSIKKWIHSHNYLLSTYYVLDVLSTGLIAVNQLILSPQIIYTQVGRRSRDAKNKQVL